MSNSEFVGDALAYGRAAGLAFGRDLGVIAPEMFGAVGDGINDDAAAIALAVDTGRAVVLTSGSTYLVSTSIALPPGADFEIQAGATIKASAGFSADANAGGAVLWSYAVAGGSRVRLHGTGTIDCNQVADKGYFGKFLIDGLIEGITVQNCAATAIHIGDQAQSRSFDVVVRNVVIYAPITATYTESGGAKTVTVPGTNASTSIGLHMDNVSDYTVDTVSPVGYRTGAKLTGPSGNISRLHPWTSALYGPMSKGVEVAGSDCKLVQCYADTPTSLGDAAITDVYGVYLTSSSGGTDLVECKFYLAGTVNGWDVSDNNKATAVYSESNSAKICVFGGSLGSASSSKKWKEMFGSSSLSALLKNVLCFGMKYDGNAIAFSGSDRIPGAVVSNLRATMRAARGDVNVTLGSDSDPIQPFGTPLTADRDCTLPASDLYGGLRFIVQRLAAATGAFNLNVKTGATTLKALTAGQWAEFVYDESGAWKLLRSGTI